MFVICALSFISADELIHWESKISIKNQLLKFIRKSQNPCILLKNGPQAPEWFNKILMIFLSNYKICEFYRGSEEVFVLHVFITCSTLIKQLIYYNLDWFYIYMIFFLKEKPCLTWKETLAVILTLHWVFNNFLKNHCWKYFVCIRKLHINIFRQRRSITIMLKMIRGVSTQYKLSSFQISCNP